MVDPASYSNNTDNDIGMILDRINEQIACGETIDLESEIAKHPCYQNELRKLLPTMELMCDWAATEARSGTPTGKHRSDSLAEATELGDYRIVRELGRGGMGVVYEAHQLSLDRRVALKVLPMTAFLDDRQLQRFKNEAQASASLQHPNIVSIYGVGCERAVHFYAMDLIEGADLASVVADIHSPKPASPTPSEPSERQADTSASARLSTEADSSRPDFFCSVARLGIQVAEALQYAHDKNIIHRDIKPANLLLDRRGNILIADFGLAQVQSAESLTLTGDLLGTIRYMSLEQVEGGLVDGRTDIYSLGLTLYELLSGVPAYNAKSKATLLRDITTNTPPSLRRYVGDVPRDLETIVEKAISKDSGDRYQSARDLANDLDAFLQSKAIHAKPSTQLDRVRRFAKRNPALSIALVTTFSLVALIAISASVLAVRAKETARLQRIGIYARDMVSAGSLARDGKLTELQEKLLKWVEPGKKDLRGFEWYHLWAYCSNPALIHAYDHEIPIDDVQFIGVNQFAIASFSSDAKIWSIDADTRNKPLRLRMRSVELRGLNFHQSTSRVSVGDAKGNVAVWDPASSTEQPVFSAKVTSEGGNTDDVWTTAFNQEGSLLAATGGMWDRCFIRVWQLGEQDPIFKLEKDTHCQVAFGPSDDLILSQHRSGDLLRYNVESGALTQAIPIDASGSRLIEFSEDRKMLAITTYQRYNAIDSWSIELWQTDNWTRFWKLGLPTRPESMHLTSDGRKLAWGDRNGEVWFADVDRKTNGVDIRFRRKLHPLPVNGISLAPDGRTLVTGGVDGFASVWDIEKLETATSAVAEFEDHEFVPNDTCFTGGTEHDVAVAIRGRGIVLWDTETGERRTLIPSSPAANLISLSQAGEKLVAGFGTWPAPDPGSKNRIAIWNVSTNRKDEYFVPAFGTSPSAMDASPDGIWLAACTHDCGLVVLNLNTGEQRCIDIPVKCVVFSRDGKTLVVGDHKGQVRLLSCPEFSVDETFRVDDRLVDSVDMSADGRLVVGVGFDRNIVVYDRRTGKSRRFAELSAFPNRVRFSPDGQRILTASLDGQLQLWMTETGDEVMAWKVRPESWARFTFSADGNAFAVCGNEFAQVVRAPRDTELEGMSKSELRTRACQEMTTTGW